MKRGVRAATGAVVVIAAILLVLPGVIGYSAESTLRSTLKTISQQGAYRIELVDFRRGWFTSRATSKLVLEGQYAETLEQALGADPGTALEVTFNHTIHHGPVALSGGEPRFGIAYAETEMRLPRIAERLLAEYFGDKPFLTFRTTFPFTGGSTTLISNPDYKGAMGPHTSVQWDGASGRLVVGRRAFDIRLRMPLFKWEDSERLLLLRGMTITSDQKKRGRHLWLGDTAATVEEVRVISPNSGESARIDNLDYKVKAVADGPDRIDASAVFGVAAAEFEGGSIGASAWTVDVDNLSALALDDAYDLYNQFRDSADQPERQRTLLNRFLTQSLPGLLSSPVELRTAIDMNVDGPYAIYKGRTAMGIGGKDGDVTIVLEQTVDALDYDEVKMHASTGRLRLARLDGDVLGQLYGEFVRILSTEVPEAQREKEMQRVVAEKSLTVLRPDTRLTLEDVAINMPDGGATAHGELGFDGGAALDYSSADRLMQRLEGALEARIDENALLWYLTRVSSRTMQARLQEQGRDVPAETVNRLARTSARTELGKLERQSMVRRDGEAYVLEALFRGGKVMLNGVDRPDLMPPAP